MEWWRLVSKRRDEIAKPSKTSLTGALPSRWFVQDDDVQDARFDQLANHRVSVQDTSGNVEEFGPFFRDGAHAFSLFILRCDGACRTELGSVWATPQDYRGSVFMWAEMVRVVDKTSRPPLVRTVRMVLDDYTRDLSVIGECTHHGNMHASVAEVLQRVPRGMDRFSPDRKPATIVLRGVST